MNLKNVIIESERLKMVPTSEDYAEDIFREFTDEITRFMMPKTPQKIEETLEFIRTSKKAMEKGEELEVIILDKNTGEFIGHGGIRKLNTNTPVLGIWIKKSSHGQKFGREAVKALKEWADKNLKYKYLEYPVDKRNIPSRKIAESLGGTIARELKKTNMAGNLLDEVEYRISHQ